MTLFSSISSMSSSMTSSKLTIVSFGNGTMMGSNSIVCGGFDRGSGSDFGERRSVIFDSAYSNITRIGCGSFQYSHVYGN
ncbi:hypothetical protein RB653_005771 [Dictyostelium firmibasis]|uniref:Uncharacterized protein n=1 Tax=Dictyostelium firmibasis TaxID=79012 RepID=A0AAN7YT85_9MYCE